VSADIPETARASEASEQHNEALDFAPPTGTLHDLLVAATEAAEAQEEEGAAEGPTADVPDVVASADVAVEPQEPADAALLSWKSAAMLLSAEHTGAESVLCCSSLWTVIQLAMSSRR